MEAELALSGIDYRDFYRTGTALTWRRVCVLCVRHPRPDGPIVTAVNKGERPWTRLEGLVDHLRMTVEAVMTDKTHTPKPHPDRPKASASRAAQQRLSDPHRRRRLADAKRRARERRRAIEAGEIT